MRLKFLLFFALFLSVSAIYAQRGCASMEVYEAQLEQDPERVKTMQRIEQFTQNFDPTTKELNGGILTIPVIVHVVWNTSAQNISDAQIASQIAVMNDDFRRMNNDRNNTPSDFTGVASDTEIEFCLIETIRVQTNNRRGFGTNDRVKNPSRGGSAVVTPASALNVWVCDIGGGILGYAQFPGGSASTDGVVCDYRYFGTTGTATAPFDLGRTMTHEVGHYLNLRHIWGDTGCGGDDFVSDTPLAGSPNYTGSPCTYPGPNTCNTGSGDLPDMFQNYMDYSDDACMNLFTTGQSNRMWAAIQASRPGLLSATCNGGPTTDPEICDNGIDDDGDGLIDCDDDDCTSAPSCDVDPGGCDAPTGLSHARRKGGREATLSWNSASGATAYEVEVYRNGSLIASGTVSGTSANISGLIKNDAYTWRVRSVCSGSVSDWSNGSFNARLTNQFSDQAVAAYPNPIRAGEVIVSWNLGGDTPIGITEVKAISGEVTLHLMSISGQMVRQISIDGTLEQASLDVTELASGVYIIHVVTSEGETANTKLVKL
ncbi:MAG: M43 family zinc metalloprotease [Lewinella sp.]